MKQKKIDQPTSDKGLTDDELARVLAAIETLTTINNPIAITLQHNIKASNDDSEKRKWISMFYAHCFQLLSFINMGKDAAYELEDFKNKLHDMTVKR